MVPNLRSLSPVMAALMMGGLTLLFALFQVYVPTVGGVLSFFSGVPLFLLSLGRGWRDGVLGGAIAAIFFFLFLGLFQGLSFFLTSLIPFFILSYYLLKRVSPVEGGGEDKGRFQYPLGIVLSHITVASILLCMGSIILLTMYGVDIRESITRLLEHLMQGDLKGRFPSAVSMVDFIPGMFSVSWMLKICLNAWLAQKILTASNLNIRSVQSSDAFFPTHWDMVAVASMLGIIISEYLSLPVMVLISKTTLVMSGIPLLALGLRLCYLALKQYDYGKSAFKWIIFLTFLLVWPALIIVLLGFIEPWYGLTERLTKEREE